ncbi:Hypothetical protein NGAL_HAMBI2605_59150 [Neorhizobium galegae bv. orientalis]|nr:Hypothetical protein NGAL_HAMBI2605_59150 [Neorhizobium galegae bv. orientalis]
MPADPRALKRYNTVTLPSNRQVSWYNYAANETAAEVIAAGWFNTCREVVKVGDCVDAIVDVDGTIDRIAFRFTAVPSTGNVTVAYDGDAAGA